MVIRFHSCARVVRIGLMSTPARPLPSGGTYTPPEDNFQILTASPLVRFLTQAVQPPSVVYVTTDDTIVVGAATTLNDEVVTVSYRLLKAGGQVVFGQFTVAPAASRTVSVHAEPLAEGFLLSVSCKAAVATTRGETFVRLFLTNSALGQGQPSYMLMADYVTTAMAPGHPNGRQLAPVEGPGHITTVAVPNPPIGSDWAMAVFPNSRWRLISWTGTLDTSAVAGTRVPCFQVNSGAAAAFKGGAAAGIGPGTIMQFCGSALTAVTSASISVINVPIPPNEFLFSGGTFQTNTDGLQAGDAWAAITLQVEEWLDNV